MERGPERLYIPIEHFNIYNILRKVCGLRIMRIARSRRSTERNHTRIKNKTKNQSPELDINAFEIHQAQRDIRGEEERGDGILPEHERE